MAMAVAIGALLTLKGNSMGCVALLFGGPL